MSVLGVSALGGGIGPARRVVEIELRSVTPRPTYGPRTFLFGVSVEDPVGVQPHQQLEWRLAKFSLQLDRVVVCIEDK